MKKNPTVLPKIALFTLIVILGACVPQTPSIERSVIPFPSPLPIPTSEAGKVTVIGRVISLSNQPISQIAVWLAQVIRQGEGGIYVLDSRASPGVYTNEEGIFMISNVDPGEYVIVIGDPEGLYEIITESSGKAKVWNIPSDQIFDIGELKVSLPRK